MPEQWSSYASTCGAPAGTKMFSSTTRAVQSVPGKGAAHMPLLACSTLCPLPPPIFPHFPRFRDFSLLNSQGLFVILVMVDYVSKACKFIPLPKLSLAKEMANLLLHCGYQVCGLYLWSNILSDWGPHLCSLFWKAIHVLMGITSSLSSGFYPESNSQTVD